MTELFFSDQTRVHFALARTEGLCGPVRYPDFAALWHEGRLGPLPPPVPDTSTPSARPNCVVFTSRFK